jgi:hypothetical protein
MHSASYCVAALLVISLSACGSSGSQGPAGPPTDRSKMYCRDAADSLNLASGKATVTASCDSRTDMPWSGGCWSGPLPSGVYLAVDQPTGWDDINVVPSWNCAWAAYDTQPNLEFGGHAEICCYRMTGVTP